MALCFIKNINNFNLHLLITHMIYSLYYIFTVYSSIYLLITEIFIIEAVQHVVSILGHLQGYSFIPEYSRDGWNM
jgi:hypothetical protein